MKKTLKKYEAGIISFCVISLALVMIFAMVFAQMAGELGISQETGKAVIYSCYIYINIAMLAPFAILS